MFRFYLTLLHLVGFLLVVAIAAPQQRTTNICNFIDSKLPGRVSYPGNSVYTASQSSYYSGFERDLNPGCIFTPNNTAEVSRFIKLVNADGKNGKDGNGSYSTTQIAIRAGGHSLFSGAANIQGGVTVDMRSMKSVVLSEDHKVASIGGGGIWSNIYPQLVPHNLTVLGGRVPGIAIGGFSTGGKLECRCSCCGVLTQFKAA